MENTGLLLGLAILANLAQTGGFCGRLVALFDDENMFLRMKDGRQS